jgi:two-component system, NarL family, invasion response regulator UvrY
MLKILIADDHAIVRRGVKDILNDMSMPVEIDEAESAQSAVKAALHGQYDIVLLDISFPDGSGLDVLRQIRAHCPQTHVLLLSMYPEEQYALRGLRAGASGYLTKESAAEELVVAIQKVSAGGKYVTRSLAERLATEIGSDVQKPPLETLSDREFQVLTRLGNGKSIGEIAAELSLSPKTVSTYRARLTEKLNLATNSDIVRFVIENKLEG